MLVAALALLQGSPIVAPPPPEGRQWPIEEIAADLAYGFCPLYLAGQFTLTAPELAERGFGSEIMSHSAPKLGEVSVVRAFRDDGEVAFGGAPGRSCMVVVAGTKYGTVLFKLRESMTYTGLAFTPTANLTADIPGLRVETYRAPLGGQMLYVQLIQKAPPGPTVSAQLFAMDK